jgi:FimV-like protein
LSGRKPLAQDSSLRPELQADSVPASEGEPSTQSEVRTKLDLARHFIDMGDPESARHMLGEVLEEGDPAQKQKRNG